MAYRANFFLEIFGMMVLFGAILFLWLNAYRSSAASVIGGYTLPEMLTYIIGGGLISSVIMSTAQGDEIEQEINEGFVSNYLLKPINVNFYWLTRDVARKIIGAFFGIIAFSAIILLAGDFLLPPVSLSAFLWMIGALLVAMLLHFEFYYLASVSSFWLGKTWSFRFGIRVIIEIAAGAVIPLSFLPGIWKDIFAFLPFKFFAYFPLEIYLGKIPQKEIMSGIFQEIGWLAFLGILCWYMWKRGVKNYTASGA